MKKNAFILAAMLLFLLKNWIVQWAYPDAWQKIDGNITQYGWQQAEKYDEFYHALGHLMLLVLLPVAVLKGNSFSNALAFFLGWLILYDLIDRLTGINTYQLHDIIVVASGVFFAYLLYRYENPKG